MAGSRIERLGSIFTRVQGLMKSGAIKPADKPLWYDVYKAFPPKVEPKYDRLLSSKQPVNILYKEDFARVHFYKTYGNPDIVNIQDEETPCISQKFVQHYLTLHNQHPHLEENELYNKAVDAITQEGVKLRSLIDIQKEKEERRKEMNSDAEPATSSSDHHPTPTEVFGERVASGNEPEDYIDEDIIDPKLKR